MSGLRYPRTTTGVQDAFTPHTPHLVREIAQGRPVFVLRIMPWADDVSGNRSKQYNAHMNMYIANINLPHKLLSQEYFVRFWATLHTKKDWTTTYDCKLQQEILFRVGIHLLPADNPQQAETTSTVGSSGNLWRREDDSGGSATHRESDEGYHSLFAPGKPRTPADTVVKIKEQILSACLGVAAVVETYRQRAESRTILRFIGLNCFLIGPDRFSLETEERGKKGLVQPCPAVASISSVFETTLILALLSCPIRVAVFPGPATLTRDRSRTKTERVSMIDLSSYENGSPV
ncbi:hypothetical protein B0H14DRAFT_2587458 [Mycena olivaceomarginata]|nr:hypothetical protein B0H14DRAFT_2587458 [Mycena olivaceomarginata]